MPQYHPVSFERHGHQQWKRYSNYLFAAGDAVAPLTAPELAKAVLSLAIALVPVNDRFTVVAVQGFQPNQNLFVLPDGRWAGDYIPAHYRGHPFALLDSADGQQVLCIDEAGDHLTTEGGERFFDEPGKPSQVIGELLTFLGHVKSADAATRQMCDVLQQYQLIVPWPLTVKTAEGDKTVEGLFRIDEAAFNALPAEALFHIRQAGALPLVYCQLLSMQNIAKLSQLVTLHAQLQAQQQAATTPAAMLSQGAELNLEFLKQGDTLRFG